MERKRREKNWRRRGRGGADNEWRRRGRVGGGEGEVER